MPTANAAASHAIRQFVIAKPPIGFIRFTLPHPADCVNVGQDRLSKTY
jgi:hypothetical protein